VKAFVKNWSRVFWIRWGMASVLCTDLLMSLSIGVY